MFGIGLNISHPAANTTISRNLTVSGSVTPFAVTGKGKIDGGSISFNGAAVAGASIGLSSFTWTGNVPNNVRPGQTCTIEVSVSGIKVGVDSDGSGDTSITVVLENVIPELTWTAFQSPSATVDANYVLPLSGTLRDIFAGTGATAPSLYTTTLRYTVKDSGGRTITDSTITPHADATWAANVSLAPGDYTITIVGSDNFASSLTLTRSLTVYRYDTTTQPKAPAGTQLPTTKAGIPTTSSVTTWTRLEPQVSGADFNLTTRARVFDPLWMMTRQWQIGEFQGEDIGTPVQVRARATHATFSRYHPGELTANDTAPLTYRSNQWPLEMMVERRPMKPVRATDVQMLTTAVDAGLHFLRMLDRDPVGSKYRTVFATRYAMPPLTPAAAAATDADTVRFVSTMAGRAPDARQLSSALGRARAADFKFDATLNIAAADVAAVQALVVTWLTYYTTLFNEPATDNAWTPSRLEYATSIGTRFSAQAQDGLTLSASEFGGGQLDWSAFDVNDRFTLTTTGDAPFTSSVCLAVPAPVTVKGAPAPRYWEMEDANVAYGLLSAGPTDLMHLMMIEYAGGYGNDWFVLPMTLPIGSATRLNSLVVTDSFGVRSLVRPMGDPALPAPNFSLWQLSHRRFAGDAKPKPVPNLFFFPPSLGGSLESGTLEEVQFLRDEMANLAWGVERLIEGGLGAAISLTHATAPPPAPAPHYVVETLPPDNWVPLMPVQVDPATGAIQLRRASTLQLDGSNKVKTARSRVLNAASPLAIYDEEIPREGVRITQQRRLARWIDGSTWVWTSFRNEVGSGEGSAGLLFDQTGDGEAPT